MVNTMMRWFGQAEKSWYWVHLAAGLAGVCILWRGKSHHRGYPRAVRWFPGQIVAIFKLLSSGDMGAGLRSAKKKYGDIYWTKTLFSGSNDVLVLNDPDDWNEVVVRQENKLKLHPVLPDTVTKIHGSGNLQTLAGPKHQLYRKIFSSLLTPKALECFAPIIVDAFSQLWKKLEELSSAAESPETKFIFQEHIRDTQFELMCKILYGMSRDGNEEEKRALERMRVDFEKEENGLFMPEFTKAFKEGLESAHRNKAYLRKKFRALLDEMKKDDTKFQKVDSHVGSALEAVAQALIKHKLDDDKETFDEIIDNLNLLLEASHGTSIYVTTSMLYFLHLPENKSSLERLRAEVSSIKEPKNMYLTLKNDMPFAEGCANETMRLAPIIEAIIYASDDTQTLKIREQTIPAPKAILVALAAPVMDPKYFVEPEVFRPGRWVAGDPMECPETSKTAFRMMGVGRHVCLGQNLARLALKAALFSYASDPSRTICFDPSKTQIKKCATFPSALVNDGLMGRLEHE